MAEPLIFVPHRSATSTISDSGAPLLLGLVSHVQPSKQYFGLSVPAPVISLLKNQEEVFCLTRPPSPLGKNMDSYLEHAVHEDSMCRVHCQYTEDWGFGVAHLLQQPAGFESAVSHLYNEVLNVCKQTALPYFVKMWNYIEGINDLERGIERYQLFNSGRRQAFLAAGYPIGGGVSAACALGAESGMLSIAFLINRQKALNLENPRQVSAYCYPDDYGQAQPLFARATLVLQTQAANILFISGTASIVGHASLHAKQVEPQTHELLRNVQSLINQANGATPGKPWSLNKLVCRVYVRHSSDAAKVQAILQSHGIENACFLKADICRQELLVEMEATATDAPA